MKNAPLPVSVLTGFLGSGKTTLLSRLLRDPDMGKTAVIINEFGEIGLDHDLIESSDEDFVQLSTGCLCCTIRDDLVLTLTDLLARRRRGDIPAFERILIETTGLADPAPVLQALMTNDVLAEDLKLETVITTVDAVLGEATLDEHPESVKQAAVADRLVVTKTDMAETPPCSLQARLRQLNPGAPIHTVIKGDIGPTELFAPTGGEHNVERWLGAEGYVPTHHDGAHDHDVNRHDEAIRAYCISREQPISAIAFTLFLETLSENCGADLLRVKGILNIAESSDQPAVIHGVQHVFHPPTWLDAWPSEDRHSRLVLITRNVPERWIEALLETLDAEVRDATARRIATHVNAK